MNPTVYSCMVHFLLGSVICVVCIGKSFGHLNLRELQHEKTHIFKESIPNLDSRDDLLRIHRMTGDYVHRVVFVTKQRNSEELLQILHEVSDPASIKYGQHLSREEVTELTANAEAHEAVVRFVNTRGASIISKTLNGEYITCDAPISVWERIFNCEFFMFHQSNTENAIDHIVRAESYSIPRDLEVHVESVFNTVQMPYRHSNTRKIKLQGSSTHITPDILKSAYNMGTSKGSASSTQGIYASINQNFSPNDLSAFQLIYGLAQQAVSTVIGGHSSSSVCVKSPLSCAEANLDVQYVMATSTVSPTTFWYTDFTSFSSWLVEVADVMNPPLVLSISYGIEESYVTIAEHRAFNIQAIKLGAMGVTIVVASGDNGAVSKIFNKKTCVYAPSFPASSPYVTAVGATMGPESNKVEVACQSSKGGLITSGGGFSSIYSQPSFQENAVSSYFTAAAAAKQSPHRGYNATGRGFPDVSLAGHNYIILIGGVGYVVSGTSASAPVMAGMFSNINAARIASGKGSAGWVNPAMYANSAQFVNDITSGDNKCAAINYEDGVTCCDQGYYATTGWDPVTGLGSINYGKMEAAFLSLGDVNAATTARTQSPVKPSSKPTASPSISTTASPSIPPTASPSISPTASSSKSPVASASGPSTAAPQRSPLSLSSSPSRSSKDEPTEAPNSIPSSSSPTSPIKDLTQTGDSNRRFQCMRIVTITAIILTAAGMAAL